MEVFMSSTDSQRSSCISALPPWESRKWWKNSSCTGSFNTSVKLLHSEEENKYTVTRFCLEV